MAFFSLAMAILFFIRSTPNLVKWSRFVILDGIFPQIMAIIFVKNHGKFI